MDLLSQVGPLIDRFAECVADQKIRPFAGIAQIHFERVVIGVCNRLLCGNRSVIGTQWPACSVYNLAVRSGEDTVFGEWPACRTTGCHIAWLAETQAKRRVARIRFLHNHQMMTLISCVAQGQQGAGKELTLNRKHVALVVGHAVVMKEVRGSIHRKVIAEIDLGLRVPGRSVQWWRWERESLARGRAVGCSNEGRLQ